MEKIVKTRKDHECCYCDHVIKKGESANYLTTKEPTFDKDFIQTGIIYVRAYLHLDKNTCDKNIYNDQLITEIN